MAVVPTGNIFKSLEFDGESSKGYGVYITGAAVYNAPEREVEMITIPGRNGSFALDHGRFQNIEVTYPAGIFADNELDFAQAVSVFRNFLCSKKGYCRLTDDYNPDEYRMAIYKSGLEVTPATLTAGQFNITFECKPQRFLMSGESAVSVASGDTIFNPTLFESSPMLEVTGYGTINIGDQSMAVDNSLLGEVKISTAKSERTYTATATIQTSNLNTGDSIYCKDSLYFLLTISGVSNSINVTVQSVTNGTYTYRKLSSREAEVRIIPTLPTYANGSFRQDIATASLTINVGGTDYNCTYTVTTQYKSDQTMLTTGQKGGTWPSTSLLTTSTRCYLPAFYGDSTKSVMPTPMYIDLDLGEAYGEVNGEMLSFNNTVSMPAKLPTLASGTNMISYSNTVTALKIIPHWWKI